MADREIEEIKSRLDIVDLVGEYVRLTPAGANHKGLCPFHSEKTPSFMVNGSRQMWRCFGCAEGGDAISFFMKAEGLEFPEAIKVLAKRVGVELQPRAGRVEKPSPSDRAYGILDLAARYWHQVFIKSSQAQVARDYLAKRGISQESIDDFQLGYSADSWDNLIQFLKKKGFSDREIFAAGLSVEKNGGRGFYDRFRGRVMFPIADAHGRILGFGARALKAEEQAKYINSPQGDIYDKSAILYGLHLAKKEIRDRDLCILVEGYMDVIPSHQVGVKNVVSISGTALTQKQVSLIKRFTSNLALALDMDAAGQNAAERSADLALANDMDVKVIALPQGKDPGECATNNPDDWRQAIASAVPVMEYFLKRAVQDLDLAKPEAKKAAAKSFLPKVAAMPNRIEQEFWLKKLADKLSVSEKVLWESMPKSRPLAKPVDKTVDNGGINGNLTTSRQNKSQDKNRLILQRILVSLFSFPKFTKKIIDELPTDVFDGVLGSVYKNLAMYYTRNIGFFENTKEQGDPKLFDALRAMASGDDGSDQQALLEEAFLASQDSETVVDEREMQAELANLTKILKADYINSKITALKSQLEEAENKSDRRRIEDIYSQLSELIKRKALLD